MADQKIVDFLAENLQKFAPEDLKASRLKDGFDPAEIDAVMAEARDLLALLSL